MSEVLTFSVKEAAQTGSDHLSHVNASSHYGHFCNPFSSVRQSGSLQHRLHVSCYTTTLKHHPQTTTQSQIYSPKFHDKRNEI
jgi:hypothetical protein